MAAFWAIVTATGLSGVLGAMVSIRIKLGTATALTYMLTAGWTAPLLWAVGIKHSPYSMLITSAIWSVVYEAAWLATNIYYGEATSVYQVIGAIIVTVGLIVMGA
jgi:predicted neutral ceramidase superfamily lipid hydrolase